MAEQGGGVGVLTFLFTDLEGSTHLLQRLGAAYSQLLADQYEVLRAAFARHGGREVGTRGDALFVVFDRAADAVRGAVEAQLGMAAHQWPEGVDVRVRIGVHAGEAVAAGDDYVGLSVHQASRICSAAHGGQILVSGAVCGGTADVGFLDLGRHRLKDLDEPMHLFQAVHPGLARDFPRLRLDAVPGNLPKEMTRFVGRDAEVRDTARHLAGGRRVISLTGAGGSGKTRLAIQVAAAVVDRYVDGVWLVELAAVSDPTQVPATIADVLGVREDAGRPLVDTLCDKLASRELLLVLDNCEHLLLPSAEVAEALVQRCPMIDVLATSQEALAVPGEIVVRLGPLSAAEAVELFVDRASSRVAGFDPDAEERTVISGICARLDGIPLAIELAAARVPMLTARQILERLDDQFRVLTGGSRTAVARQQTMRAAVDWSHQLLAAEERRLLRRLAVFAGTFRLESAERVATDDDLVAHDVLELLGRLVARSLVIVEEQDGEARYRLLESIRQYAQERLADAGEVDAVRDRHLRTYAALAERAEPELTGPDQAWWFAHLAGEWDNLRAAMDWAATDAGSADTLLEMAASLWRFWLVRGHWSAGREWLRRALAANAGHASVTAAKALAAAGDLAAEQGDAEAARPLLEQSLAMARELGDPVSIANALSHLGNLARSRFDYDGARSLLREALDIRRAAGDRRATAVSLRNVGLLAALQRDHHTARLLYEEALPLARELGEKRVIATIAHALAIVAFEDGDRVLARELVEEGLALARELGDRAGIAEQLVVLAGVARAEGDAEASVAMMNEALRIWRKLGSRDAPARAHATLADMALATHNYVAAEAHLDAALARWRELDDQSGVARLLDLAGWAAMMRGDTDRAAVLLEESLAIAEAAGDEGQRSATLHSIGELHRLGGRPDEALDTLTRSLQLANDAGWRSVLWWPVRSLGALAREQGDVDTARAKLHEALALCPKLGRRPRLADCLEELAALDVDESRPAEAAVLLGAAAWLRDAAGAPVPPVLRAFVEETGARARRQLGHAAFTDAYARGARLAADDVVVDAVVAGAPALT